MTVHFTDFDTFKTTNVKLMVALEEYIVFLKHGDISLNKRKLCPVSGAG